MRESRCMVLAIPCLLMGVSPMGLEARASRQKTPDPSAPAPVFAVGQREHLDSEVLGERREILVSVPPIKPGVKLPLLVALDGERSFRPLVTLTENLRWTGQLPPVIVAGVVNVNRGRDMLPGFEDGEFAAGDGAGRFLAFLADELPSFLAERHPISDYRILAGHSNAGAFTLQALARRPGAFQAYLASSPSSADDRLQPLLARTLARPGLGSRFLFVSVGDDGGDIPLGTARFAKTITENRPATLEYHYEYFPGENHGSVASRAYRRGLRLLGALDPRATAGPARYLNDAQRRARTWERRFGASYGEVRVRPSASRPLIDHLLEAGPQGLPALWEDLRGDYGDAFLFDPVDFKNLVAYLEAEGRDREAQALRELPGFWQDTQDAPLNNYGTDVDLSAGLAAHIVMDGGVRDLAYAATGIDIQNAVPCPGPRGQARGAYRFDGKTSQIQISGNPALRGAGSLTVSAWIRPRVPAAYAAWVAQTHSGDRRSRWRLGLGTAAAAEWGATTWATRWTDYWTRKAAPPVDQWAHTAAVFDKTLGMVALYLDGRLVEELWGLALGPESTGPLLVGTQRDDGVFFNGDVGEVRVYNRALSAGEIAALHAQE